MQSSYYSGTENDDETSDEELGSEYELVTPTPKPTQQRRKPKSEKDGRIFNMIDQINDIKVRNLSRKHERPGVISEEDQLQTELEEKDIADDTETMMSLDLESPRLPQEPEKKPKDPNLVCLTGHVESDTDIR